MVSCHLHLLLAIMFGVCRYLLEPLPQVLEELQEELKASQETVKRLTQQREHATKALAATESELRELFKTRPELGRQLAAAGAS